MARTPKPNGGNSGHGKGCVYDGRWLERYIVKKLGRLKHKIQKQEIERQDK